MSSSVLAARRSPSSCSVGGMSGHHTRMRGLLERYSTLPAPSRKELA